MQHGDIYIYIEYREEKEQETRIRTILYYVMATHKRKARYICILLCIYLLFILVWTCPEI